MEDKAPQGAHGQSQRHVPVLLEEAIEFLRILPGGTYMDATLGLGGHSTAIARRLGPEGHLIAFDRDPEAIESAAIRFMALRAELKQQMPRITIHAAAFAEAASWAEPQSIDGILADFGVSSLQLDTAQRGFSFQADAPLDMRMDPRSGMHCRTSGKSGERRGSRKSDLQIRRREEVAENRQSNCQGAAGNNHGTTRQSGYKQRPGNKKRSDSSSDSSVSSSPNLRE